VLHVSPRRAWVRNPETGYNKEGRINAYKVLMRICIVESSIQEGNRDWKTKFDILQELCENGCWQAVVQDIYVHPEGWAFAIALLNCYKRICWLQISKWWLIMEEMHGNNLLSPSAVIKNFRLVMKSDAWYPHSKVNIRCYDFVTNF
jgi:hypothetical protein